MPSWSLYVHPLIDCTLCPLAAQGRTAPVEGLGPVAARVMLVGEAPGATEDKLGIPFVGQAGKLLDQLLEKQGVRRDDCWVTNVVKCRPPANREPTAEEEAICTSHHLAVELRVVAPLVVVAIGKHATSYLLPGAEFGRVHGIPHRRGGRVVLPVYHPAASFHNSAVRAIVERDFSALTRALGLAAQSDEPIKVVDGAAPAGGIIAIDTEANIRDGKLVAVSMSVDGRTTYVSRP